MANQRKGVTEITATEKKGDFAVSSIKSFRERMMEEEKASEAQDMKFKDLTKK
jgi:hypothetical protein